MPEEFKKTVNAINDYTREIIRNIRCIESEIIPVPPKTAEKLFLERIGQII